MDLNKKSETVIDCIFCNSTNTFFWQRKKGYFKCKDCNKTFTKNSNFCRGNYDDKGRYCIACKTYKNYDDFFLNGKVNGNIQYKSKCKKCYQKVESNVSWKYKSKGINREIFEKEWNKQNGCCLICDKPFKSERKCFIDHNHENGKYRGLLCPSCNTTIGLVEENIDKLLKIIDYLKKHHNFT